MKKVFINLGFNPLPNPLPALPLSYIFLLSTTILLSACNLTPKYTSPITEVPTKWSDENIVQIGQGSDSFAQKIEDEQLQNLINTALKQNLDIEISLQRTMQARAQAKIAGATLWPTADASLGAGRSFDRSESGNNSQSSSMRAGVALNYEVDLWQRNKAGADAAKFRVSSSLYDADAVKLTIISDVIINYGQLITLQRRIEVARKNLKNAQNILNIIETRYKEGSNSALEVAQQRTSIYGFEASITSLEQQLTATKNALAILTGAAPQQFFVENEEKNLPTLPQVNLTPPSALLANRPDIRSLEAQLKANNADIGAAKAAFYPSLNLGLDAGFVASSLRSPASSALELSSSILAPIFSGGRLQGNVENVTARQKELAANYKQTILIAFGETEDALSALKAARQQKITYEKANNAAADAYKISKERFDAGSIDFLNLLDAQRALLQAEDNLVQADFDEFTAAVQLQKAMGRI